MSHFLKFQLTSQALIALVLLLSFTACNEKQAKVTDEDEITTQNSTSESLSDSVVEVTAIHDHAEDLHLFQLSTQETTAGWNTFRFNNASDSDHFFMIYKAPQEAITAAEASNEPLLDYWYSAITVPFQEEYNPYVAGEIEYGEFVDNLVAAIAEKGGWFFDPGATPMGGPGFTAAGTSSETTVHLDPGQYIVECYVKDENEIFHSYIGMLVQLDVTEEESRRPEPQGSVKLSISSTNGIELNQSMSSGSQTVEIYFEDQEAYEHLLGHNVQLVQLADKDDETLLNNLEKWMDWRMPGSLVYRAPEGAQFLGGAMEMTAGGKAFFHVNLKPGDYAWIAEVPDAASKNMLKTFTIPGNQAATQE